MATPARGRRRYRILPRLGLEPTIAARLGAMLDAALADAEIRSPGMVAVLDAGCGHTSPLIALRSRIDRLVGVDVHAPDPPLSYLDEFATVDLCRPSERFAAGTFDLALSSMTMEHFTDPWAALANMHAWLRPGGHLILTTVNRRHPFVALYLAFPDRIRRRLQPYLKSSPADAHPLVGRCNDPAAIRSALSGAGFEDIELEAVPNLARSWSRRLPSYVLGLIGDLLAQGTPSRRSTILAVARKPHTDHARTP